MYHYNIKCFTTIFIVNYLVQIKVDSGRTIRQANCFNTINAYYGIPLGTYTLPIHYANYAILHFRKCKEAASGIKLLLSDHGIFENPQSRTQTGYFRDGNQATTPRGSVKKVNTLEDLMKNLPKIDSQVGNTSNSDDIQENISTVLFTKIDVDIYKIPEDVVDYYTTMTPYVTSHCYFKTPERFCLKYKLTGRQKQIGNEEIDECINQILERFDLRAIENDHHSIVQKLYTDYAIGELYAESEKYAIEYLGHVSKFCKLEPILNLDMPAPATFCKKKYLV